jgi:1,4-alpha-glucan branching enzyme
VVSDLTYGWGDDAWMASQREKSALEAPISIYEIHLGSFMRSPADPEGLLGYREIAPLLIRHVQSAGFTHVEFLPLMEHPFYGSWGYQSTGFFAPTARYGSPCDLMWLIDQLHQAGIGVLLDWVPSHFPADEFALGNFDGTHLYEHADPRQGFHPDWKSYIFNYGRNEVRSFLLSSAEHWLSKYHVDGLRVDAVASMLYLDYSRKEGEWIPNRYGGRENLEAVQFLKDLNVGVYAAHPSAQTMAEDSTAWPGVSRPTDVGGLGFGYKWDMGWMHDTLEYFHRDPIYRRHHHNELTFRGVYAFSENYILPLSHDEVVHGKGALVATMPGDDWQRFANLRLLYGYQFTLPGKKLLFMGDEIAQWREWSHDRSLDWHLLEYAPHQGILAYVTALNHLYRKEAALFELDTEPAGFSWIEAHDEENSTLSFIRRDKSGAPLVVVCNFTPTARQQVLGVPLPGRWFEAINSDDLAYGGSGVANVGGVETTDEPWGNLSFRATITLPPLAVIVLRHEGASSTEQVEHGAAKES